MNYAQAKRQVFKALVPALGDDYYFPHAWHVTYRVCGFEPGGTVVFDIYEQGALVGKKKRFPLSDVWRRLLDGAMKRELR